MNFKSSYSRRYHTTVFPNLPKQIMNVLTDTITLGELDIYDKKTKTFTSELSDHDLKRAPVRIKLINPKTGNSKIFIRDHVDYADSTHEDIAGYWYINNESYKLLLIND